MTGAQKNAEETARGKKKKKKGGAETSSVNVHTASSQCTERECVCVSWVSMSFLLSGDRIV